MQPYDRQTRKNYGVEEDLLLISCGKDSSRQLAFSGPDHTPQGCRSFGIV